MKKLWRWLRTLDAGEWIALVVFLGACAFVLALVAANIWSVVVGSLQPEMAKVKGTDYDLIAQRSMSAAAWWMVIITGTSAVVGAAGLYLIYRTLKEAKRSADAAVASVRYSEKAAASAEISAKSAQKALKSTEAMGERQVRAYAILSSAKIRIERRTLRPFMTITVTNSGQTPASGLILDFTVQMEDEDNDEAPYSLSFTENLPDLAGQKDFPFEFDTMIRPKLEDLGRFQKNRLTIRLFGTLRYKTVFPHIVDKQRFSLQTVFDPVLELTEAQRLRAWIRRPDSA